MKIKNTLLAVVVGVLALLAAERAEAQAGTNSYAGLGPQGPFSIATAPASAGNLPYYYTSVANVSLGTNATGYATNQIMPGTTNVYSLTNTAFVCQDYDNVTFEFIGSVSNRAATVAYPANFCFVLSNDGSNFDTIVDPQIVSINTQLTNGAGQLIWRTNFVNTGAKAIGLLYAGLPSALAGTNTYLTNIAAMFSGQVGRKHVNVNTE